MSVVDPTLPVRSDINDMFARFKRWHDTACPDETAAEVCIHLREEAGELSDVPTDLEEAADVFLTLLGVINRTDRTGADLMDAAFKKMVKNEGRKWAKTPAGNYHHVE